MRLTEQLKAQDSCPLDVLASKCRVHQSTDHSQDHSYVTQAYTSTLDHGHVLPTHQHQTSLLLGSVTGEVATPDLRQCGAALTTQHTVLKRKRETQGRSGAEPGRVLVGTNTALRKIP